MSVCREDDKITTTREAIHFLIRQVCAHGDHSLRSEVWAGGWVKVGMTNKEENWIEFKYEAFCSAKFNQKLFKCILMKEEYYFNNWSFLTPPLFATFTNFFSSSAHYFHQPQLKAIQWKSECSLFILFASGRVTKSSLALDDGLLPASSWLPFPSIGHFWITLRCINVRSMAFFVSLNNARFLVLYSVLWPPPRLLDNYTSTTKPRPPEIYSALK